MALTANLISDATLEEIRQRVKIEELIGETVALKRTGANLVGLCPFHTEDTPSFSVTPERGLYKCFGCDAGGDAFRWVQEREGLSFPEAVRLLADRVGVTVPDARSNGGRGPRRAALTLDALARDKALPVEFLRDVCGLVEREARGDVAIPYRDETGQTVETKARTKLSAKAGSFWPKGKPLLVYGVDRLEAARADGALVIVEGESDCWTLWHHGFAALGIPGASAWKTLEAAHVAGFDRLFVIEEHDAPGKKFVSRIGRRLQELGFSGDARVVRLPAKDPNELHKLGRREFQTAFRAALEEAVPLTLDETRTADTSRDGRTLVIVRKELAVLTAESLAVLGADDRAGLYVRARRVARVSRSRPREVRGIKRPAGAPVIELLTPAALRLTLDRAANFQKSTEGLLSPELPPTWLAETILAMAPADLPFLPLEGVTETPTLRPDGSVLQVKGYDEETALLFEPIGDFPPVPDAPTLDDARAAIETLVEPLLEFPFVAESDRSAALAFMLTLAGRAAIAGPCPLFAFRAPTPGTGKGLLASVLSIIGSGRGPTLFAPARDAEEERKRILTVLLMGSPAVLIDNVVGALGSESLSAALTATEFTDRLLGGNTMATAPARAVWCATGNNIAFKGDLARRVVPCDLDPLCERPEDRRFKHDDLLAHVTANRAQLVVAGLTLLRAFHVADCPRHGAAPMGSFETWDRLVRSALIWTGCADPCKGREKIREESDADLEPLRAVLETWHFQHENKGLTLAESVESASPELRAALAAADPRADGKTVSTRTIGNLFRKWKGRVVGGLRLTSTGKNRNGMALWRVEKRD